jgi:hypothetical protein
LANGVPMMSDDDYDLIYTNLRAGYKKEACDLFDAIQSAFYAEAL